MSEIKKDTTVNFTINDQILGELMAGTGVVKIMKKLNVPHSLVNAVRKEYIDRIPDRKKKEHIGARFDGPLTKKVLAECERLGINRNDFLEMVTRKYFKSEVR